MNKKLILQCPNRYNMAPINCHVSLRVLLILSKSTGIFLILILYFISFVSVFNRAEATEVYESAGIEKFSWGKMTNEEHICDFLVNPTLTNLARIRKLNFHKYSYLAEKISTEISVWLMENAKYIGSRDPVSAFPTLETSRELSNRLKKCVSNNPHASNNSYIIFDNKEAIIPFLRPYFYGNRIDLEKFAFMSGVEAGNAQLEEILFEFRSDSENTLLDLESIAQTEAAKAADFVNMLNTAQRKLQDFYGAYKFVWACHNARKDYVIIYVNDQTLADSRTRIQNIESHILQNKRLNTDEIWNLSTPVIPFWQVNERYANEESVNSIFNKSELAISKLSAGEYHEDIDALCKSAVKILLTAAPSQPAGTYKKDF